MILTDGMTFEVADRIDTGMMCGITNDKIVRWTMDHARAGIAREYLKPGDRVIYSGGGYQRISEARG